MVRISAYSMCLCPQRLTKQLHTSGFTRCQPVRLTGWLLSGAMLLSAVPARGDDLKPETMEDVKKAAVMVLTYVSKGSRADTPTGSGSGFFINSTGLAITNNHVVDPTHMKSDEEKQTFHYTQGKLTWKMITDSGLGEEEKTWDAVVLYQNESADQALLQVYEDLGEKVKLKWPHYLRLAPESRLKERMKVWAFGFPGGDQQSRSRDSHPPVSWTTGNVLQLPRTPGGRIRMIYTDVIARPGNSGGPMVDQDGFLVGTVTLMTKPEGREDTGGANYSSLVPPKLTTGMVRNASALGKLPTGTDVSPFMDALTNEAGRTFVTEYERFANRDVLSYEDGDRIYGRIASESVTWVSALGKTEAPTSAVAYVMTGEDKIDLFLEGGNRITSTELGSSFEFVPEGGETAEPLAFNDVGVVAFRMGDSPLEPITGQVMVLDTDVCHLVLADAQGTAKFRSRAGTVSIPFEEILRFDTEPSGKQVVRLKDGRRMTGRFEESPINAVIAATKTPISFDLGTADNATVEILELRRNAVAGLSLVGVMAGANEPLRRITAILESADPSGARAKLDALTDPGSFRSLPGTEKDQIRLLDAVALLREGKSGESAKAFRKCVRAENENIAAYAQACADVLKHYGDFRYDGKPLSDRLTFIRAGEALADERIQQVRDLLKDAQYSSGERRGDYVKTVSATRKYETTMMASALFAGVEADDELIRLWKCGKTACEREIDRIDRELEKRGVVRREGRGRGGSRRSSRGSGGGAVDREIDELNEQRDQALEVGLEFAVKLWEYGFRIEDPDIQEFKEKRSEGRSDEPEEP